MNLNDAIQQVIADTRESYPRMGSATAIKHARDTVEVATLDGCPDDDSYAAYHAVLTACEAELAHAVAAHVNLTLSMDDIWLATTGEAIIDGMPALEWIIAVSGEDDE